jgi:glyoxylase-like metal-dependent hydrolase (beta-lactamase superfamily II)
VLTLEPYHLLDPVLARLPWPFGRRVEAVTVGPVRALRMARLWGGRELMAVHCFAVGDTLVDAGLACYAGDVLRFAHEGGVRRALVTHHHEDHVGGAAGLVAEGVAVHGPERTARLVREGFPVRFYQHVLWGKAPSATLRPFEGDEVALGPYVARVVPAPGHCDDQVALHVPAEGWLFSGDAFLHERVKIFRRDEDFAATVATLERFLTLDFDALFCAHRPLPTGGRAAIGRKLAWLREVEGKVRTLHARGWSARAIARELPQPTRGSALGALALGDVSVENLVRSILYGPRPRREARARQRST